MFFLNLYTALLDIVPHELLTHSLYLLTMYEVFEKYLREWVDISNEELEVIRTACTEKSVKKWEYILKKGEVWNINCFIARGCFRLYTVAEDGTEHTLRFGVENWWICDRESYNDNTPSEFNVEALVNSEVLVWSKDTWAKLMDTIPALKLFNETLLERGYIKNQGRILSLISISAEDKYLEFQKKYPNILNKVPLHMVASYLGISSKTLSRVRREFAKQN